MQLIKLGQDSGKILFVKLEKAGTHKYIKRLPNPSTGPGKSKWIYFYTKQQLDKFKKTGEVPGEKGKDEEKGGLLSGIMSFFGFKNDKQAQDKIKETFNANKKELAGVGIETFSDYLNEYLQNKEKWDKRFEKKSVITKDKKTGAIKKKKTTDGKTTVPSGKKSWNMSLMRKVAGMVGSKEEKKETTMSKDEIKKLISEGWSPAPDNKMLITPNKDIIDQVMISNKWFIVDEGGTFKDQEFATQADAVKAWKDKNAGDKTSVMSGRDKDRLKKTENYLSGKEDELTHGLEKEILKEWLNDAKQKLKDGKVDEAKKILDDLNMASTDMTGPGSSPALDKLHAEMNKKRKEMDPKGDKTTVMSRKTGGWQKTTLKGDQPSGGAGEKIYDDNYNLHKDMQKDFMDKMGWEEGWKGSVREKGEGITKNISKEEETKKWDEFVEKNKDNYKTKNDKGYEDHLKSKGISKGKDNEIEKIDNRVFRNNGVEYSIGKSSRGYNLVGGEGAGKEIDLPYNMKSKISDIKEWVSENIGKESWKIKGGADKASTKYESESDKKEKAKVKAEKEQTEKGLKSEKQSNVYSDDSLKNTKGKNKGEYKKKIHAPKLNLKNVKDAKEAKLFQEMNVGNQLQNDLSEIKPVFSYSKEGQDEGVWTDSRIMILDKDVADSIYNRNKKNYFLSQKKGSGGTRDDDSIISEIVKRTEEGNFPNWKQVVPDNDQLVKEEAKFTGKYNPDTKANSQMTEYQAGDQKAYFNASFVASLRSTFPNATFHINKGETAPAVFKENGKIKAVIMPLQGGEESMSKLVDIDSALSPLKKAINSLDLTLNKARMEVSGKDRKTIAAKTGAKPGATGTPGAKKKKYEVGQISESTGMKKVAPGKWVKVGSGQGAGKPEAKPKGKPGEKPKKKPKISPEGEKEQNRGKIKTALKKVANILADMLSGKEGVASTGQAVEEVGENVSAKAKVKKQKKKEEKKK